MSKVSDDNDKVLVISLPGYDVNTVTPEQCIYHSGFTYEFVRDDLEGYLTYTTPSTFTADTTYTVASIAHNLGYVPEFQVFIEDPYYGFGDLFAELPYEYDGVAVRFRARINSSELQILLIHFGDSDYTGTFTNTDVSFKYQIFVNQLNKT